jgi:hypothetical protein
MGFQPSFSLIDVLRATLASVEESREVSQDDSAFRELRDSLVRAMAELTVLRSATPAELAGLASGPESTPPSIETGC